MTDNRPTITPLGPTGRACGGWIVRCPDGREVTFWNDGESKIGRPNDNVEVTHVRNFGNDGHAIVQCKGLLPPPPAPTWKPPAPKPRKTPARRKPIG